MTTQSRYSVVTLCLLLGAATGSPAGAYTEVLVNNGLAPPNAANVFSAPANNRFIVRNDNCASSVYTQPCAAPGAATAISIDGSTSGQLYVADSSSATLSNGRLEEGAVFAGASITLSSATIDNFSVAGTMNGGVSTQYFSAGSGAVLNGGASAQYGMILDGVTSSSFDFYAEGLQMMGDADVTSNSIGGRAFSLRDNAVLRSEGAYMSSTTLLADNSLLIVRGTNFRINGVAVGYGTVASTSGSLLGDSIQGGTISMNFVQGGGIDYDVISGNLIPFTGTLVLVPEPGTGMLTMLGLVAVAARRRR